jgi:FkbM family methyltransferase
VRECPESSNHLLSEAMVPNRTPLGHIANVVNSCLSSIGLTISKLPERNTLERLIQDLFEIHDVNCVIDVGAHHGEFGGMLRSIGYTGKIHSFEPSSDAFERLDKARRGDRSWEIYKLCLGDTEETAQINKFQGTDFNSLYNPSAYALSGQFGHHLHTTGSEKVDVKRLDSVVHELGIGISAGRVYLKVDTQGHDMHVLRGARDTMRSACAVQVELSALPLYDGVPTMDQALSLFREFGLLPVGFQPVCRERDKITVIEWDCILAPHDTATRNQEGTIQSGSLPKHSAASHA